MPTKLEVKILPRRFDLIKKMYLSDKVIAINKKDQIFNWFFEQFEKFQSESSYTYELLWRTFHEILEMEKQQKTGHRVLIKSNAVNILSNTLKHYPFSNAWASVILSSIATLLEIPRMNTVLIADVDNMFTLLIETLKIINKIYECNCSDLSSFKEAKYLANIILDILENLPAANEEEKALLLADSLQDLAIFMHIASDDKKLENLQEKLAKKVISILFNLKKKSYETLLTQPDCPDQVGTPNSCLLKFFNLLQVLLNNEDETVNSIPVFKACGTLMKNLLSTFLLKNKSSLHSLKVVSLFFAVAGLDIPILFTATSCCNSLFKGRKRKKISVIGIYNLIEGCLMSVPEYFISFSVPEGYVRPSLWIRGVSTALLDLKISKNKTEWLKCLCSLLKIAPSIVEDDLVLLIKNALLNISLHGKDSKKQYCELFDIVLETHSKLYQVPKFFVKFLLALTQCMKENSGGNLLVNGQILLQVQKSIAKCIQELTYGQIVDLWKIFVETFSTLENMSQVFMVSRGFIFYVAQLFSIFLLHAPTFQENVPANMSSKFETLIRSTDLEIKKNISALKETDSEILPTKNSILLLYFAIGEVKLLHSCNHGKFPSAIQVKDCEETFDFQILHPALGKDCSTVLEACLNSDNKTTSLLVFQLLLQKIKVLVLYMEFSQSEDLSIHIKKLIPVVLKCLQESSSACESWDEDLCTVNTENYGTAYWITFLKMASCTMNYFDSRDIYQFCCLAQDILFQVTWHELEAKHPIYSALKNIYFKDFKPFQTAFVSAIWRKENFASDDIRDNEDVDTEQPLHKIFALLNSYSSKSLKYAQRTPKSNKSLGNLWDEIKEVSDLLNGILISESLPTDKLLTERIRTVLNLFRTLSLQYLLPGNQMKSIIGLSVLFFLTPQSCQQNEAVILCKEMSQQLLDIFDGARSIWLFDFIKSGPYLRYVVKTIESVIQDECEDNFDWAIILLENLITLILKNTHSLNDLEGYVSNLGAEKKYSIASLMTLCALLKKLAQALTQSHKPKKYEETAVKISLLALQGFMKQMKRNLKESMENVNYHHFIRCYTVATEVICCCTDAGKLKKDCFDLLPVVLEKMLSVVTNPNVSTLKDEYILFISCICKCTATLSEHLPENFVSIAWEIILSHLNGKLMMHLETYHSLKITHADSISDSSIKICRLCSLHSNETCSYENSKNFQCCKYNKDSILVPFSINEFEEKSLEELSQITPVEILSEIFQNILKELDSLNSADKHVFVLQKSILIFKCVIDANNDKITQPLLQNHLLKFLLLLQGITNQSCKSYLCQIMIRIPILEFIDFIVKGNKGLPKQALLQTLHCVSPAPLEVCDENYELFVKSFSVTWRVVYDLFMHHTSVITSSPAAFLYCVAKLLKSIVRAGAAEPLSRCNPSTLQQVQLCAQNMNRLLTVLSRNKGDFSKLAPYLIADYVDTVQHITLDSHIKESVLAGIHRLLDICDEYSIKMIALNINYVCSEIYSNLVKNYRQNKRVLAA